MAWQKKLRDSQNADQESHRGRAREPYVALKAYRNTPLSGMAYSPAQMLMSRRLCTKIPATEELLKPKVAVAAREQLTKCKTKQKQFYDSRVKPLPELQPEDSVRVRGSNDKVWRPAVVLERHQTPRSYVVATADDSRHRRNRRHI
jgi:hypothetical protein